MAKELSHSTRLSNEEITRYSRHLILPEVGMAGQLRLKSASVLLIGAGGLGAPAAMYLTAAGVGKIGMVDFDMVDVSNLQRQIIHSQEFIGKSKLESARKRLGDINSHIRIETYETQLTAENVREIFSDYDIIIDSTDNFPTRYLINYACVCLGKPMIYGSIYRFEGQVSVFDSREGPCYRCLYPEPPPPEMVPSCAEGGVLGVLPGLIGTIQATEAIKRILRIGEALTGRLLLFNALTLQFRELKLRKNPACPVCGKNPTITEFIDYQDFCGLSIAPSETSSDDITASELKKHLEAGEKLLLLDVREPLEYELCHLKNATLIPLGQLPEKVNQLSTADTIVVYCHVGVRSKRAVEFMKQMGFTRVKNLLGGIDAWAREVDPDMPVY